MKRSMRNTYTRQRGFAMAAMFIAVALLGGTVMAIEGPGMAQQAHETTVNAAPTATNESSEIDEILHLADNE